MSWRRELEHWRAEQRARMMVRVAERSFKRHPGRLDQMAGRLVAKAAGEPELDEDLRHEE